MLLCYLVKVDINGTKSFGIVDKEGVRLASKMKGRGYVKIIPNSV